MSEVVLVARGVHVTYGGSDSRHQPVHAVNGVDLRLGRGETVGLVGESGCGKSSLARALVGLEPMTGELLLFGERLGARRTKEQARRVQIVFQDPFASLNPRLTVRHTLEEMLRVHHRRPRSKVPERARELVALVGLPERALDVRPAALSGGQRQRVAIARAIALEPDVLVADEPTTALDVSVQAVILELIAELRERLSLTLLLITHNLAVVAAVCDRTAVMYLGRIVEEAPTAKLLADPRHPYTRRLLEAVPRLGTGARRARRTGGDPADPSCAPNGCPYHSRCAIAVDRCLSALPELRGEPGSAVSSDPRAHRAACLYAWTQTDRNLDGYSMQPSVVSPGHTC